jgi:E3 ubiquitin-protein ligase UBR4
MIKKAPILSHIIHFNGLLQMHAPCVKPTLMRTDSDDWKEFISKPALKYILRFLTGLATEHEHSQVSVVW